MSAEPMDLEMVAIDSLDGLCNAVSHASDVIGAVRKMTPSAVDWLGGGDWSE